MDPEPLSKANVLVVDDTIENLHLLSRILGAEGYEARPVPSGAMAMQAVELDPPDLIMLDINMSPMNGYEVCERLKANARTRDIPVMFVSALDEPLDKVRAFGLGAVDYVTKPYQVAEVLARVKTHLQLRAAQLELEQSYDKLRQLEVMRDELVHMVVHDLRSPLSALISSLAFLKEGLTGQVDGEVLQDLNAGEAAARNLIGMANDLLDVSRLENNRVPVQLAEADLGEVVRGAVENVRRMQVDRKVSIDSGGSLRTRLDVELIRRVVENLVSNSLRHTPKGRPIRIVVEGDRELRVTVHDEGQGIPEDQRTAIFDKFGTTNARRDGAYHSIGLGLAFCKLAVEAHGGRIGVDSELGKGSAFWFVLPHAAAA
jgi:two-component system sensor histidine kinase/response regulator